MKLEVGMYIRTNLGIEKITSLESEYNCLIAGVGTEKGYIQKKRVVKVSRNLIDLIEVGDYVNGSRVVYFMIDEEKSINEGIDEKIGVVVEEEWEGKKYLTKDIKTIVTKEQFQKMEYRIGE